MKKLFFLLFFLLLPSVIFAYTSPGTPVGFVNDFAGMMTVETRAQIEVDIRAFEQTTGHEISVMTIASLDGDYIENYAEKLFKEWGIGKKGADNGVLLLISRDDKKMRIEVGYGLEGALTDAESSQIIRNTLRPAFQRGDFSGGIREAVSEIERAIQEEVPIQREQSSQFNGNTIEFLFFVGVVILLWLSSVLGRTKSWWLGGAIGGAVGFVIGLVIIGFVAKILLWVIGLALAGFGFDFAVSKNYQNNKLLGRRSSWWAGGGWGPGG
ncbi:TPM domain-containing protein, partial [Candidatus Uhrbacteria bacterium]|nr:TPM domain-containing protein [Candidatus Uhrbacteria bacterium]